VLDGWNERIRREKGDDQHRPDRDQITTTDGDNQMRIRDELLAAHGEPVRAAAELARRLSEGDPATQKAGYSIESAILAALEVFPEASETGVRSYNGWLEWCEARATLEDVGATVPGDSAEYRAREVKCSAPIDHSGPHDSAAAGQSPWVGGIGEKMVYTVRAKSPLGSWMLRGEIVTGVVSVATRSEAIDAARASWISLGYDLSGYDLDVYRIKPLPHRTRVIVEHELSI
jgi:hypothetical protein